MDLLLPRTLNYLSPVIFDRSRKFIRLELVDPLGSIKEYQEFFSALSEPDFWSNPKQAKVLP